MPARGAEVANMLIDASHYCMITEVQISPNYSSPIPTASA